MSETTVTTNITMVTQKAVDEDTKEKFLEEYDADTLEEVADQLEHGVEAVLRQTFGDADVKLIEVDSTTDE